ncbi:MAG TPA: response regulator [Gemmatimonadales bacterium]|nr:response regulator [Gemmatimonadales bacterium]
MARSERPAVWVVDDDADVRDALALLLGAHEHRVETCASGEELLERLTPSSRGCVLLDVRMPGLSGLEVQQELVRRGLAQPVIFLSGHGDIPMVVRVVRAGALDFLEKPVGERALLAAVGKALATEREQRRAAAQAGKQRALLASLSPREAEVADLLVQGLRNPEIAERLDLSQRTVEMHRARLLRRLGARTTAEAVRILEAARSTG